MSANYHHWHPSTVHPENDPECCLCCGDGCDFVPDATRVEHARAEAAYAAMVDPANSETWPF